MKAEGLISVTQDMNTSHMKDTPESSESPFHQNNLISEKAEFIVLFCEDSNQSDTKIVENVHPRE